MSKLSKYLNEQQQQKKISMLKKMSKHLFAQNLLKN